MVEPEFEPELSLAGGGALFAVCVLLPAGGAPLLPPLFTGGALLVTGGAPFVAGGALLAAGGGALLASGGALPPPPAGGIEL